MTIGRVAEAAESASIRSVSTSAQRHIAKPQRSFSGYRIYPREVRDRLRFIHDAKRLGFSLRKIGELLSLGVKSTLECGPLTCKAQAKLAAMNEEITRLQL